VAKEPAIPFPESLCHRCEAARQVKTAASVFILCSALPDKYPRQPVVRCAAFQAKPGSDV
jgi:hypothetical protein